MVMAVRDVRVGTVCAVVHSSRTTRPDHLRDCGLCRLLLPDARGPTKACLGYPPATYRRGMAAESRVCRVVCCHHDDEQAASHRCTFDGRNQMIPGRMLHRLAKFLLPPEARERIIDAQLADFQHEWRLAGSLDQRVSVLVRGYSAFVWSCV